MNNRYKRIGISGGTFDPIHYGHLITAEDIRQKFTLDKVLFIPSGMPPHKTGHDVTSREHRYNMVLNAVKTNPFFEVSRVELDREGYTYTIDTLKFLKQIYGEHTGLFFIIGADVVHDLLTWKNYNEVFTMCSFIAVLRPGFERNSFMDAVKQLTREYGARIDVAECPLIEISSTCIRKRLENGESIKYLLPEEVEDFIYKNNLYVGTD